MKTVFIATHDYNAGAVPCHNTARIYKGILEVNEP